MSIFESLISYSLGKISIIYKKKLVSWSHIVYKSLGLINNM